MERIRQRIRIPPPRRTCQGIHRIRPRRKGLGSRQRPRLSDDQLFLGIRTIQGMRTRQGAVAIRHRRCPVAGKSRTGHRSGYIQIPFHERHQMASAPGFPDGGKTPQRFQPAGSETDVRCARALFQGLHEKWGMRGEKRTGRLLHQPLPVHRIPRPRFTGRCSPKQRYPAENNQTGDTGAGTGCPHPGHHIHAFPQRAVCHHRPQRMS